MLYYVVLVSKLFYVANLSGSLYVIRSVRTDQSLNHHTTLKIIASSLDPVAKGLVWS